jgi:tetratricopeptide (TPR) repeat protein
MKRLLLIVIIFVCIGASLWSQAQEDALAAYSSGSYTEAIRICLIELDSMPKNMNSFSVLGWSLIALARYEEALEYTTKARGISPRDPRIIEILGEAHYYLGNNVDALEFFEQYAVLAPTGDRVEYVYAFMGEIYIRLEEYNHADISFSTAVYHAPNVSQWWSRLGYSREMSGDLEYSLEAYQQALTLNPALNDARRGRDRVLSQRDDG